jgi:hypothetical protein
MERRRQPRRHRQQRQSKRTRLDALSPKFGTRLTESCRQTDAGRTGWKGWRTCERNGLVAQRAAIFSDEHGDFKPSQKAQARTEAGSEGVAGLSQCEIARRFDSVTAGKKKSRWRAFWDFFVLFNGVSTASALSRTQGRPVRGRGMFLFRKPRDKQPPPPDDSK